MPRKAKAGKKKTTKRRTRKYAKRGYRIYRPVLGTSQKNRMQICAVNNLIYRVPFQAGELDYSPYAYRAQLIAPHSFHFIPINCINASTTGSTVAWWANGPLGSYSLRKALTMFQEFKIDGVYVTIRPVSVSGGVQTTDCRIVGFWDRKYISSRGMLGTMTGDESYSWLQTTARDQGKAPFIYSGSTKYSYRTKCVASTADEKNTWFDTEMTHSSSSYLPGTGLRYDWNNYGFRALTEERDQQGFAPAFWWSVRTEGTPTDEGYLLCEITTKWYISLRNPGSQTTAKAVQEKLLLDNWQQASYTIATKDGNEVTRYCYPGEDFSAANFVTKAEVTSGPTPIIRTDSTILGDEEELAAG